MKELDKMVLSVSQPYSSVTPGRVTNRPGLAGVERFPWTLDFQCRLGGFRKAGMSESTPGFLCAWLAGHLS